MNESLIGHDAPVNLAASRLFWKAPWWAKVEEKEKIKFESVARVTETKVLISYTNPPQGMCKDRRGSRLRWLNGDRGITTGFHHRVNRARMRSPGHSNSTGYWFWNGASFAKSERCLKNDARADFWWVFNFESEQFILVNFKESANRREWVLESEDCEQRPSPSLLKFPYVKSA